MAAKPRLRLRKLAEITVKPDAKVIESMIIPPRIIGD